MKRIILVFFTLLVFAPFGVGQTFNPTNGPWGNTIYSIAFNSNGKPFVGTQEQLTSFNGTVWNNISLLSCCPSYPFVGGFKPIASRGDTLIYADDDFENTGKLWLSTNDGVSFSNIQTSGLPLTTVGCITFDQDGHMLLGSVRLTGFSVGGGLWKSTNLGSTWNLLGNQSAVGMDIKSVATILIQGDTLLVGTFQNNGMFRSVDNGTSWEVINNGLTNLTIPSLTQTSGNLFCGTEGNGVFKSINQGQTWLQTSLNTHYIVALVSHNNILLAGSRTDNGGIFRSTDNGATWVSSNSGLNIEAPNGLDIRTLTVNASGEFFAGTTADGIYKSTDNGLTWRQFGTPLQSKVVVKKDNGTLFAGNTYSGTSRSTDDGATWKRISGIGNNVALATNGNVFVGSESAGLYESTDDGVTWTHKDNFPGSGVFSVAVNANGVIFAGSFGGVYRSTDNGVTWTNPYSVGTTIYVMTISSATRNNGMIFAANATTSGGVVRSANQGVTWATAGLSNIGISTLTVNKKSFVFAGGEAGIYRSTDNGNTWSSPSAGFKSRTGPTDVISLALNDANDVFAGTSGNGLWRSTDDGDTWEPYSTELAFKSHSGITTASADFSVVRAITIDTAGFMYAGVKEGIVKSNATTLPPITPAFSLDSSVLSFGAVRLGDSLTKTVSITNNGYRADLVVSEITATSSRFFTTPLTAIIAADSTTIFSVTFVPNTMENVSAFVILTHNGITSPDTITVSGTGITPLFSANTNAINFGNVRVGNSAEDSVRITNTGTAELHINAITALHNTVIVTPSGTITLAPAETKTFVLTTTSSSEGLVRDTILFSHDAAGSPAKVTTQIFGTQPHFAFASVVMHAFDSVLFGTPKTDSLTVTNTGTATLSVTNITTTNAQFSITPQNATLAPSAQKKFFITFMPNAVGMQNGIFIFTHDGPETPDTFSVSGIGVRPAFATNTSALAFGNVRVGNNVEDSVLVTNTGTAELHITTALMYPNSTNSETAKISAKTASFSVTPEEIYLSPSASQKFTVTFSPQSAQFVNATLMFTHNAPGSPDSVALSGAGTVPIFSLSSSHEVDFGNIMLGDARTESIKVTNAGLASLTVTNVSATNDAFTISPQNATLAPAEEKIFLATFFTPRVGTETGYIIFMHDATSAPDSVIVSARSIDTMRFRTIRADTALAVKPIKLKFTKNGSLITQPNVTTLVEAEFKKLGKNGKITLGIPQTDKIRAKQFAWLEYKKATDLGKLFSVPHTATTTKNYPIDSNRTKRKKLVKAIKADRKTYDNIAWAEGVIFNINLLLSRDSLTPPNFGSLLLDTNATLGGRSLQGMSLIKIGTWYDSVMTYWDTLDMDNDAAYTELHAFVMAVLKPLNDGFSAPIDTTNYTLTVNATTARKNPYGMILKGVATPEDVGIVKRNLGKEEHEEIRWAAQIAPNHFTLHQNYPNPFNPVTTIHYTLSTSALVSLKVYNVLGQEVAELIHSREIDEGMYEVQFDANGLTSGVYFYRLNVNNGEFMQTRKLLLMK